MLRISEHMRLITSGGCVVYTISLTDEDLTHHIWSVDWLCTNKRPWATLYNRALSVSRSLVLSLSFPMKVFQRFKVYCRHYLITSWEGDEGDCNFIYSDGRIKKTLSNTQRQHLFIYLWVVYLFVYSAFLHNTVNSQIAIAILRDVIFWRIHQRWQVYLFPLLW